MDQREAEGDGWSVALVHGACQVTPACTCELWGWCQACRGSGPGRLPPTVVRPDLERAGCRFVQLLSELLGFPPSRLPASLRLLIARSASLPQAQHCSLPTHWRYDI